MMNDASTVASGIVGAATAFTTVLWTNSQNEQFGDSVSPV